MGQICFALPFTCLLPASIWVYDPHLRWHQSRIFNDSADTVGLPLVGFDFWRGFGCKAQNHQSLYLSFVEDAWTPKEQTQGCPKRLINELVVISYFINLFISHLSNIYLTVIDSRHMQGAGNVFWWIKLCPWLQRVHGWTEMQAGKIPLQHNVKQSLCIGHRWRTTGDEVKEIDKIQTTRGLIDPTKEYDFLLRQRDTTEGSE